MKKMAITKAISKHRLNTSVKLLTLAVTTMMVTPLSQADVAHGGVIRQVGDLEIYQAATAGQINLTMMLDTSGSMGISSLVIPKTNPYGSPGDIKSGEYSQRLCKTEIQDNVPQWQYSAVDNRANSPTRGKTSFHKSITINGTTVDYYLRGCGNPSIDADGNLIEPRDAEGELTGGFDRLSRLKDALITLIASNKINDNVSIGLGTFSAKATNRDGTTKVSNTEIPLVDGHSGVMLVPVGKLTPAHRLRLIQAIAEFQSIDAGTDQQGNVNDNYRPSNQRPVIPETLKKASSGTPTSNAYAEVASYMMGTNTGILASRPDRVQLLYDGETIMHKYDGSSPEGTTIYWVCVGLLHPAGNKMTATALGSTEQNVYQCDNKYFDAQFLYLNNGTYYLNVSATNTNKTTPLHQSARQYNHLYKPDGTKPTQEEVNQILNTPLTTTTAATSYKDPIAQGYTWELYKKLPVGWRLGGWMKVPYQSLDIEAVASKNWGNTEAGANSAVSYRTSPFALTVDRTTYSNSKTWGACPTGYEPIPGWPPICRRPINERRRATPAEKSARACLSPVLGQSPMPGAWNPNMTPNNNERYNQTNTAYRTYNGVIAMCEQTYYGIPRPIVNTAEPYETPVDNMAGGFIYSSPDTRANGNYIRGATSASSSTAQCDSNGIYFLTDGAPNSVKDTMAQTIINKSLNNDSRYTITSKPTGGLSSPSVTSMFSGETGGWEWIGEYAKRLNDRTKNPAGVSIRTAVAGFGSSFAGLTKNADGTYDCNTATASQDAKNACKWGQVGEGYGEGGFFYTQTAEDISNSILSYIASLNNTIPAAPSGTITIPKDPYRAIGELPYAFLPTVESQLSGDTNTKNIWPGNVKKYGILDGTLYGQENKPLFGKYANDTTASTTARNNSQQAGDLNPAAKDLWQRANYTTINARGVLETRNDAVKAGGFFEHLKNPSVVGVNNVRSIWVEDLTAADATTTRLVKLSVSANGRPENFNALNDTTDAYTRKNQFNLLKYMGFTQARTSSSGAVQSLDEIEKGTTAVSDLTLVQPTEEVKVTGASIHSKPVAVSYSANLVDGRVQNAGRDDYILFGSMDGALHVVDADSYNTNNGATENLAIIPRVMMQTQSDALVPNSKYEISSERPAAVPKFGIDGHWLVNAKYTYNYTGNKVAVDNEEGVYAYGGMRLGGKGLLGFNLSNLEAPKPAFNNNISLINEKTEGFRRIGHIWAQPSIARMKTSSSDKTGTDVLIFGGGYDLCYENENFQIGVAATTDNGISATCAAKTEADGNAVYIINAKTGELLWSATYDSGAMGNFDGKKYMKHSIVGGITALDRNNDGYVDNLYFADLGGQVFRADFKDGIVNGTGSQSRVVRILMDEQGDRAKVKGENSSTLTAKTPTSFVRRFYERPNVSFYRNGSKLFAMVNVISGDRSSPLSKIRTTEATADRLYGIVDTDVTLLDSAFYASNFTPTIKDLVVGTGADNDDLLKLGTITETNTKAVLKEKLTRYRQKGWYYPLTRFDGFANVNYSKGVGKSEVIGSQLFSTVYNPDMNYSTADGCSAKIIGGSERQMYCLPWGICDDAISTNGTGGYERAGQGIQELNFGPQSENQLTQRLLIGNKSLSEIKSTTNRTNWGADSKKSVSTDNQLGLKQSGNTAISSANGDGSMPRDIFVERYILTPKRWYEEK